MRSETNSKSPSTHQGICSCGQQTEELNQTTRKRDATLAGVRLNTVWTATTVSTSKHKPIVSQSDDYDENDKAIDWCGVPA
ncbi:hypothetical protein O9929_18600 [Vibrio lentus]|nr:hypothetical protein [Vibrio lentus]